MGDCSEGVTPVPIPNTEVKPLSPDGTARASVWESRKLPELGQEGPVARPGLSCFLEGLTQRRKDAKKTRDTGPRASPGIIACAGDAAVRERDAEAKA